MKILNGRAIQRSFEIVHNARELKVCGAWPRLYHRIRTHATANCDRAIESKLFDVYSGICIEGLAGVAKST